MKRTLAMTFILILSLTGCSSTKKVASSKASAQKNRAPASAAKPTAWGKPISDGTADFFDEVENAAARSY